MNFCGVYVVNNILQNVMYGIKNIQEFKWCNKNIKMLFSVEKVFLFVINQIEEFLEMY